MTDPRVLTAAWAAEGAREARQALPKPAAKPKPGPHPRTGRRTQQAIDALLNLRRDISIGLPAEALIDRIDDVLYRLTKGTTR